MGCASPAWIACHFWTRKRIFVGRLQAAGKRYANPSTAEIWIGRVPAGSRNASSRRMIR
jgi:hypothetical protein